MPNYHISNGTIYDGGGGDGFRGDLLIEDGKITHISRQPMETGPEFQRIDAEGLWVMPGFIDIHTHYDGEVEIYPELDESVRHGNDLKWYTVVGNDRPKELNWIINHPDCHIGFSDAGAHLKNMAHYNFALRLFKFVREQAAEGRKTLTIGQAVHKVTKELADWFMVDRGYLTPGKVADIALIDPAKLDERLDEMAEAPMPGMPEFKRLVRRNDETVPYVFINGRIAWQQGKKAPDLGQTTDFGTVLKANNP